MPGAVPWALNSTVQQAGTRACERLSSLKAMPLSVSIRSTWAATTGSLTSRLPNISASVFLVMSSLVGPRPPVSMTTCDAASERRSVSTIALRSSPIETFSRTTMPASLRWRAMETELVSTIWPMSISSPIVMMEAFMGDGFQRAGGPAGLFKVDRAVRIREFARRFRLPEFRFRRFRPARRPLRRRRSGRGRSPARAGDLRR